MFGLVDCNAFFVSCERVFQPHLEGKPVIVLSSNDGCAISRSAEAKALGIQMGVPFFKIKKMRTSQKLITKEVIIGDKFITVFEFVAKNNFW